MLFRKNRSASTRSRPVPSAGTSPSIIETLEGRRLMAFSLAGGDAFSEVEESFADTSTSSVSIGTLSVALRYSYYGDDGITPDSLEPKDAYDEVESNGNFPPGQFPSGNPSQAPGKSNPNETPATNPANDPPPPPK